VPEHVEGDAALKQEAAHGILCCTESVMDACMLTRLALLALLSRLARLALLPQLSLLCLLGCTSWTSSSSSAAAAAERFCCGATPMCC